MVITAGQTAVQNFTLAPVSIEDEIIVAVTALKGNHPNPFNPETILSYDIKERVDVLIEIFNLKGQLVRTLVNEVKPSGHYQAVWDGNDQVGKQAGSGIYYYKMSAGKYSATRKMILMK
jgi:flagellar hook assembly protein FlgD